MDRIIIFRQHTLYYCVHHRHHTCIIAFIKMKKFNSLDSLNTISNAELDSRNLEKAKEHIVPCLILTKSKFLIFLREPRRIA